MFNSHSTKYPPHTIHDCSRRLYMYILYRDTSVPDYHKLIHKNIDVVEHNGGTFVVERGVVALALFGGTPPS